MHVLLVDDDADLRTAVAKTLTQFGYFVETADDGLAALELLRADSRAFVILLDLTMPRMNGWQFREEQLRDPRLAQHPVIVMSGVPSLEAAAIQADGHVLKPLQLLDVVAAVDCFAFEAAPQTVQEERTARIDTDGDAPPPIGRPPVS